MSKEQLEEIIGENMMGALNRYIYDKIAPGSFLTAVLKNDLRDAVGRADFENKHKLFEYVAYLYNYCPAPCWGSPENFNKWLGDQNA